MLGYPLDGPYDAQEARVREVRNITGPDIYDNGQVTREVYTIKALVRSGNSGGPLMSSEGAVLGVIFAAAADDQETGFAVSRRRGHQGRRRRPRRATNATSTGRRRLPAHTPPAHTLQSVPGRTWIARRLRDAVAGPRHVCENGSWNVSKTVRLD